MHFCRRFVIVLITVVYELLFPFRPAAQHTADYLADLDHLYSILKKTPSFKDQVKGEQLIAYNALYDSLRKNTTNTATHYEVFRKLAALFFPFRDNHLGFYHLPEQYLDKSKFSNRALVHQYRNSTEFLSHPKVSIKLDSLEKQLVRKPNDSMEGIYYYGGHLKVGLFKTTNEGEYCGVVLRTTLPNWEKGQIAMELYEQSNNFYRAIYCHPAHKSFLFYPNEKFKNHALVNSYFHGSFTETVYKKFPDKPDYTNISRKEPAFQFRNINATTQYIRLGNFSAQSAESSLSQAFYNRIKDSLTAPHLIVDLRNNSGGSYGVSTKFLQLCKTFSEKGKIFVLLNNGTMSQGEIFALRLKKLPNTQTFGETTMGTIAYGSNYGNVERLPSGRFQVYPTDIRSEGSFLPYETVGIAPDILLKNDQDWIRQLVAIIHRKAY